MSVLDNIIKIRALEQDQSNQMVDSLIKGMTLAQETQKTNLLAEIQKKQTVAELAKSGLQWNESGSGVTGLPDEVLTSMGDMKDAMMSPTDRALKESLLAERKATTEAKKTQEEMATFAGRIPKLSAESTPEEVQSTIEQYVPPQYQETLAQMLQYKANPKVVAQARSNNNLRQALYEAGGRLSGGKWDYKNYEMLEKLSDPQSTGYQNIQSLQTATRHLGSLEDRVKALTGNTGMMTPDAIVRAVQDQFNDPSITTFDQAKTTFSTEYARALRGSGQFTEKEIEEASKVFDRAKTPQNLMSAVNGAYDLLKGRYASVVRPYVNRLKTNVDMSLFADPEVVDAFAKHGIDLNKYSEYKPIAKTGAASGGKAGIITKEQAIAELKRRGKL